VTGKKLPEIEGGRKIISYNKNLEELTNPRPRGNRNKTERLDKVESFWGGRGQGQEVHQGQHENALGEKHHQSEPFRKLAEQVEGLKYCIGRKGKLPNDCRPNRNRPKNTKNRKPRRGKRTDVADHVEKGALKKTT